MVDCSHGNSEKRHEKQPEVLESVIDQVVAGNRSISGVMIESFLEEGNQSIPNDLSQLKYGVSITDKCIDWKTTEEILRRATADSRPAAADRSTANHEAQTSSNDNAPTGYPAGALVILVL